MLLANESVAQKIASAFPDRALLRNHPPPLENSLQASSSRRPNYDSGSLYPGPPGVSTPSKTLNPLFDGRHWLTPCSDLSVMAPLGHSLLGNQRNFSGSLMLLRSVATSSFYSQSSSRLQSRCSSPHIFAQEPSTRLPGVTTLSLWTATLTLLPRSAGSHHSHYSTKMLASPSARLVSFFPDVQL